MDFDQYLKQHGFVEIPTGMELPDSLKQMIMEAVVQMVGIPLLHSEVEDPLTIKHAYEEFVDRLYNLPIARLAVAKNNKLESLRWRAVCMTWHKDGVQRNLTIGDLFTWEEAKRAMEIADRLLRMAKSLYGIDRFRMWAVEVQGG